jgi:hypothetical protein
MRQTCPADLEQNNADVIAPSPWHKNVAGNFENLITSVAAVQATSTYTLDCFRVLSEK